MSIYAVNGKEPIAAWIPSLDTAGNGTTTLTDLVGSSHGTFSGITAAAWVSDTDAGGNRAINTYGASGGGVDIPRPVASLTTGTVSWWVKLTSHTLGFPNEGQHFFNSSTATHHYPYRDGILYDGTFRTSRITIGAGVVANRAAWHFVAVRIKPGAGNWQYTQNTIVASSQTSTGVTLASTMRLGAMNTLSLGGRWDDVRMFADWLDDADLAYLYAGGFGRGIVAITGKKRPRINGSLINSGLCRSRT